MVLAVLLAVGCTPVLPPATGSFEATQPVMGTPAGQPSLLTPTAEVPQTGILEQGNTNQTLGNSDFCPSPQPPAIFDLKIYAAPALTEPARGISFHDPVYGLCLARVSDVTADRLPVDSSAGVTTESPSIGVFNSDQTLLLAKSARNYWYVYSTHSLQVTAVLPFVGDLEVRWSHDQPQMLYYLQGALLFRYSLQTKQRSQVHNFALDLPQMTVDRVETHHMGSPTTDGRYWPLLASDNNGQAVALLVYDFLENKLAASRALPAETALQGVMISPLGSVFLAWFSETCADDHASTGSDPHCGLVAYDRSLNNPHLLLPATGAADVTLDATGQEVLVYYDVKMNSIALLDLRSGQSTALWLVDVHHSAPQIEISGMSRGAPGWALISAYLVDENGAASGGAWLDNTLFAIELKPQGRVARLANLYIHGNAQGAFSGPRAVASNDFSRVVFTSNWGRTAPGETEIYLIALPTGWISRIP